MEMEGTAAAYSSCVQRHRGERARHRRVDDLRSQSPWAMATSNFDPHAARSFLIVAHDLSHTTAPACGTGRGRLTGHQAGSDEATRLLLVQGVAGLNAAH